MRMSQPFRYALLAWGIAAVAWLGQSWCPATDWPSLCGEFAEQFRAITQEDVNRARAELLEAINRLEERFSRAGAEVQGWKRYLRWNELKTELGRELPDLQKLDEIYGQFSAGHEGLGLVCFADVRRALQRYVALTRSVGDSNLKSRYRSIVTELGTLLAEYEKSPLPETASTIQDHLDWLELAGQAQALQAKVREAFSHPNALIRVKGTFLASAFEAPVDVTEEVREIILGTDVRGKGHITGVRQLKLLPDESAARFEIVVTGVIHSDTVGFKGPARIYSNSKTLFTARKGVAFTSEGLDFEATSSTADTDSDIQDVDVTCRSACAERIAWRQTWKQKSAAEWEAARKAEQRVSRRVEQEANPQLEKLAARYRDRLRQPLLERGLFPAKLDLRTTNEDLQVSVLQLGHGGLSARETPQIATEGAVVVLAHQSWFNNLAEGLLGGMILKEQRLEQTLQDLLGRLPEEVKTDSAEEPWTVQFPMRRPIAVTFLDGRLTIAFRGETYWKGERSYPGMDVRATYRIESQGQDGHLQIVLIREHPLSVFPPGFDPSKDRLSVRQQTIRRLLERRFEKIFRETITLEPIKLEGQWAKAGPLVVTHLETRGGWLTAVLDKAP